MQQNVTKMIMKENRVNEITEKEYEKYSDVIV